MTPLAMLAVFVGAGLGALLRFGLGGWLNPLHPRLPLGTLAANLLGGLLVGVALRWFEQNPQVGVPWRLFAITGFLGGLTTFSTFSAEVVDLLEHRHYAWAATTAATHLLGSLACTVLGMAAVHTVSARG